MLCKEKTGISGVHTFRKLNSEHLYAISRTICGPEKSAELSGVSRPTINQLFMRLRIRIAQVCNASSPLSGEVEVDESYFGARRVCGKRGAEQAVNRSSSGILERHGKVSEIVPDATRKQLQSAIRGQAALEASSTRTAGEATMGWWTWATKSISGCIMVSMSFPAVIAISMALSHSGHMPNGGLQDRILTLLKENPLLKLSRPNLDVNKT